MDSAELKVMARIQDKDIDEIISDLTEVSDEDISQSVEEHLNGLLPDGKSRGDYDGRLRRGKVSSVAHGTYKQRAIVAENFRDYYCEIEFEHLDEDCVRKFLQNKQNQGLAGSTIESRYWQLISFLSSEFGPVIEQQARDVDHKQIVKTAKKNSKVEGKGAEPLSRSDYEHMMDYIENENKRLELIFRIAWQTGMRASEIANLRLNDIDYDENKIEVRTAKRPNHTRALSFNLKLKRELQKWKEAYRSEYLKNSDSDYLLPTHKSDRIYPRNLTKAVKDKIDDLGWQEYEGTHSNGAKRAKYTVHSFRKSFGLRRLRQGDSVRKVQLLLGHSDISTTQNYLVLDEKDIEYTPKSGIFPHDV